jgi:hypothetical protein
MGERCAKCGKELRGFFEKHAWGSSGFYDNFCPEYKGRKLCLPCIREIRNGKKPIPTEKHFKDALEEGRRIVVIKDAVMSADGIGKHIELYSHVAEKFGYVYKSETHFPDAVGISLSIIFEKVIPTANETNFVNCEYCTARYDANLYFKCPQCGSPTT